MGFFSKDLSKCDIEIEHLKARLDRLESNITLLSTHITSLRGLVNRKLAKSEEIQEEIIEEQPTKEKKIDQWSMFKL